MAGERLDFLSPLSVIPGLGPKRLEALRAAGLERVEDLLYHFPRRWLNKSKTVPIGELIDDEAALVRGEVTAVRVERGRRSRLRVGIKDGSGTMELLWFQGFGFLRKAIQPGKTITAYGKPSRFTRMQMVHPEVDLGGSDADEQIPFEPRYPLTGALRDAKVGQKRLKDAILWLFTNLRHFPRKLPEQLEKNYDLPSLREALFFSHFPRDLDQNDHWFERIIVEELYEMALSLRWNRKDFGLPGRPMKGAALQKEFVASLPFELTEDQRAVLRALAEVSASELRMHHLLQGDVGSGKTVTAFVAALPALAAGFQVAWLAPTTVLAEQSFKEIEAWLEPLGYAPKLLTGGTKAAERRQIHRSLALGELTFVVGTHAIISDKVSFGKLGMVVVDEQHRFGSEQRLKLQKKESRADLLMMSATPIPASLAATVYSDLEALSIRSMPKGRKVIKSHLVAPQKRADMLGFFKERLAAGEQCYWVVPRIDSVEDECNDLADLEGREIEIRKLLPEAKLEVVHGRMKDAEKEAAMLRFSSGESRMLLATTVIEVGVNVPNATVMVIENCERFGLAQLHQLRGRVGRSSLQSWCLLLPGLHAPEESVERLQKFCETTDGFAIAELDLTMRGTGEVLGNRQSGFSDIKYCNILERADQFREIKDFLDRMLAK